MKFKPSYRFLLDLSALAIFVYFTGFLLDAWNSFPVPRGCDTIAQLHKVGFILDFWPHISWNYQWGGGMPMFRVYPPSFYYIIAVFSALTNHRIEFVMVVALYILYFLAAVGVYGLMLRVTGSRQISILTSLFVLSSPSVWDQSILGGVHSRAASLLLLPLSMWLTKRLTDNVSEGKSSKLTYVCTVLLLAFTVSFNPFMGYPALLLSLLIPLFYLEGWRQKVYTVIKIFVPVLFLNSYFYVPFLYTPLRVVSESQAAPRNLLLQPLTSGSYLALSPAHVALTAVFLAVVVVLKLGAPSRGESKFLKFCAAIVSLSVCFVFLGSFVEYIYPFAGLVIVIMPLFLMPLAGLLLHRIVRRNPRYAKPSFVILLLVIVLSVCTLPGVSIASRFEFPTAPTEIPFDGIYRQLDIEEGDTMHRIGIYGADGSLGMQWNYRSVVPQTRDYFFQGILYPDWYAWLHDGVWYRSNNYAETNFLLDWWGVKWILSLEGTSDPGKFLNRPDYYSLVANVPVVLLYEFVYLNATTIVSANNVPSLLIVSEDAPPGGGPYRGILNDLAYSDFNSRHVIPIHGSEYIDDYSVEELKRFDAVLLYGYNYHDRGKAWKILEEYVKSGGGLIIDTGYSPDSNSTFIPLPSPVERTVWTNFGTEWQFSALASQVTERIQFTKFSPSMEEPGTPWNVSSSLNQSIRNWAQSVLWDSGHPLVAIGEYGGGRVVWSGMNLPWHIAVYKNDEESAFLVRMISWATKATDKITLPTDYEAERVNPEKMVVRINNAAKGVLFKEFHFRDWRAFLEEEGGKRQELQLYKAGPDFMYVLLPNHVQYPVTVVFEFIKWVEYVGVFISVATLFTLLTYCAVGSRLFAPFTRVMTGSKKRITEWWYGA